MKAAAASAGLPLVVAERPIVGLALAASMLALLLGLQPITTDLYLPALPMLTQALGAPMAAAQLTMSALILSFGLAQMVWGPVADRSGRRPVLVGGLALYCAASIGCASVTSIELLIAWRVVQGCGLAAAVVCARAIVRDLYEPLEGAHVMALSLSGLGVIALAAPLFGGALASLFGWRGPLVAVAVCGALILAFIYWQLPETLRTPNPRATRLAPMVRTWWVVGRHPVFVAWALLVACTYGGLFVLLAASSFVYMDVLGLSPGAYGAAMALGSLAYLAGTLLCRRWISRHGMVGSVRRGAWFSLAGGVSIVAFVAFDVTTPWAVLLPQCLYCFGHGIHQPCGQTGVVAPFPQAAGAASALAGLLLALVATGIGLWLGTALDSSLRPLAYGLAFWAALTCAAAWWLVPRATR